MFVSCNIFLDVWILLKRQGLTISTGYTINLVITQYRRYRIDTLTI